MTVEATTARVLRLLALLQRRPNWTAAQLAAELGFTDRSVRRDVERLRALGYPAGTDAPMDVKPLRATVRVVS